MRFAWIRSNQAPEPQAVPGTADRLLLVGYNLVWWIPVVLAAVGVVSYRAGFLGFLAITGLRAALNAYRNNAMPLDEAMDFPLRMP